MNRILLRVLTGILAFGMATASNWAQDPAANAPASSSSENPTTAEPTPPMPETPAAPNPAASEVPVPSTEVIPPDAAPPNLIDSIAALVTALKTVAPGDVLTLKNGVYTTSGQITVRAVGTAERPIVIRAETPGGVEISGTHGFKASEPATHLIITGFKLTHAAGKSSIAEGTSHVRFTRNTFLCPGEGASLTIVGDDAQVDYNEFGPKKSSGAMIAVSGVGNQVARRLWIHHNYFHDFDNDGASGAEMIRFGLLSSHRASTGEGLVEHNLFVGCRGVNDLISNRSSGNTYRYNTFVDSPTSHLTIRQGNDCVIAGNYFRNTEGVRLYGDRHQIFSNYFEKNYIGVNLGNGTVEFADTPDASTNLHDRPDECVIAFNTFLDNNTHYQMSGRSSGATPGLGATNTTFANNLVMGGAVVAKIDGPNTGAIWSGNLLWNHSDPRAMPPTGYTTGDPLLAAGADGIKRPAASSPALGAGSGNFPKVTFDLDGQPRPEKKAIGADELSEEPVTARFLSREQVGPEAAAPDTTPASTSDVMTPPSPPDTPVPTSNPEVPSPPPSSSPAADVPPIPEPASSASSPLPVP
jgi:poly(beta-D-mannuronate) lyase